MKSRIFFIAIYMIIIVVISCNQGKSKSNLSKIRNIEEQAVSVEGAIVVRGNVESIQKYTAEIVSIERINVAPEIPGKVVNLYVKEGDRVKKGQVLAQLDSEQSRLQYEQAKAGLEVAKASFSEAEKNYKRMKSLYDEDAVSQQQFEQVELAYKSAQAQLKQAEAGFNLSEYYLNKTRITSPINGIVTFRYIDVGEVFNQMTHVNGIFTIESFDTLRAKFSISEQDLDKIREGIKAKIFVPYLQNNDDTLTGIVSYVGKSADIRTKNYPVYIDFYNPKNKVKPGSFGSVEVVIASKDNAIMVPKVAIQENSIIYIVKNKVAKKVEVVTGIEGEKWIEIISGINEGDTVLTKGIFGLPDNTPVKVNIEKN